MRICVQVTVTMDAKDLRTESALGERNNDGSKYTQNGGVALPCDRNKTYQEIGSNSLAKVDVQSARPCAVIGPDRVVPPPATNEPYYKKNPAEPWQCMDNTLHTRRPPEYPHKLANYQNPSRNISPRQTFQENMQRIMVPSYNSVKLNEDTSYAQLSAERSNALSKNIKLNVPPEAKYCDVPYTVYPSNNEPKNVRNPDMCLSSVNPTLTRTGPHGWPPGSVNVRPSRGYGAPELYQYQEYPSCAGPRPIVPRSNRTVPEEPGYIYPDPFYHQEGNVRYKPYPTVKERFSQQRYEYISNYNTFHPPPPFPTHKYELQKPVPPHPYPPYPQIKYRDRPEPIDGYQRNQQANFNIPYHNQMVNPNYPSVLTNSPQNKIHVYPPDAHIKGVAPNKIPYDNTKAYIEYENGRPKMYTPPESYLVNQMGRMQPMKNQIIMPNYPTINMHNIPPNPYYKKDTQQKNYEYMQAHYRGMDPNLHNMHNPMIRHPPVFSPNTLAISPTDSSTSNDTSQTLGTLQEDCGYVSQSSSASVRSIDSGVNRVPNDYLRRYYDNRYGPVIRTPTMMSKSELNSNSNSKEKKNIDVRQFLSMWNEGDDGPEENSSKETIIVQPSPKTDNKFGKGLEVIGQPNQEQLYVLGLVNVPSEELSKYEHIQKISKLPENIKGYNHIELLTQFEEAIESSDMTNYKTSTPKDFQMAPKVGHSKPITGIVPPRPLSPLDVEAKISQSVIHKEVGCNFEIKPCSPKMLNVEVATPVQNILAERAIEKVANPVMLRSPRLTSLDEKIDCNIIHLKDHRLNSEPARIPSCKMVNPQFSNNNSIDSIKNSYSLQDLESNSGLCLASLPRLDNDIELNFPEVNQQFINANKGDSTVLTNSLDTDLPALDVLEQSDSHTKEKLNDINTITQNSDIIKSPCIIEPEKDFSKLTKYRKSKLEPKENLNAVRTDSVIIKNPENAKNFEESSIFSPNCFNNQLSDIQQAPMNLTHSINNSEKESKGPTSHDEYFPSKDTLIEDAIDFSLNKTNDKIDSIMSSYYKHSENLTEQSTSTNNSLDGPLTKTPRFCDYNLNTQHTYIDENDKTDDQVLTTSPIKKSEFTFPKPIINECNKDNNMSFKDNPPLADIFPTKECMSPKLCEKEINDTEEYTPAACIRKINDVRSNSLLPIEFVTTTAELSPIADSNSSNDMMDYEMKSNDNTDTNLEETHNSFKEKYSDDLMDGHQENEIHQKDFDDNNDDVGSEKNINLANNMGPAFITSGIQDAETIKNSSCDEKVLPFSTDTKETDIGKDAQSTCETKSYPSVNSSPVNIKTQSNINNLEDDSKPTRSSPNKNTLGQDFWSRSTEIDNNLHFNLKSSNNNVDTESQSTKLENDIHSDIVCHQNNVLAQSSNQFEVSTQEPETHLDLSHQNITQEYNLNDNMEVVNFVESSNSAAIHNQKIIAKLAEENKKDHVQRTGATFFSYGSKEMYSPRIQNLVLFSEGSTNILNKKYKFESTDDKPFENTSVEDMDISYDIESNYTENSITDDKTDVECEIEALSPTMVTPRDKLHITSDECDITDPDGENITDTDKHLYTNILLENAEDTKSANPTSFTENDDNIDNIHRNSQEIDSCVEEPTLKMSPKIEPNFNIPNYNSEKLCTEFNADNDPILSQYKLNDEISPKIKSPSNDNETLKQTDMNDDLTENPIDHFDAKESFSGDKSIDSSPKHFSSSDDVPGELDKPSNCCGEMRVQMDTSENYDQPVKQTDGQSNILNDTSEQLIEPSVRNDNTGIQLGTENNCKESSEETNELSGSCNEISEPLVKVQNQVDSYSDVEPDVETPGKQLNCCDDEDEELGILSDSSNQIKDQLSISNTCNEILDGTEKISYCTDDISDRLDKLTNCNDTIQNQLETRYKHEEEVSEQMCEQPNCRENISEVFEKVSDSHDQPQDQGTEYSFNDTDQTDTLICNDYNVASNSEQTDKELHTQDTDNNEIPEDSSKHFNHSDTVPKEFDKELNCYLKVECQLESEDKCNEKISREDDVTPEQSGNLSDKHDKIVEMSAYAEISQLSTCIVSEPNQSNELSTENITAEIEIQSNSNDEISEELDKTSNFSDDVPDLFDKQPEKTNKMVSDSSDSSDSSDESDCSDNEQDQQENRSDICDKIPTPINPESNYNDEPFNQSGSQSNCTEIIPKEAEIQTDFKNNLVERLDSQSVCNNEEKDCNHQSNSDTEILDDSGQFEGNGESLDQLNSIPIRKEDSHELHDNQSPNVKVGSPTLVENESTIPNNIRTGEFNYLNKNRQSLKRSLSDSALNAYSNNEQSHSEDVQLFWPFKRRKVNNVDDDILTQNLCNIIHNNNRRNSISSFYNEENVSFCILIDNSCIIAEEESEEQEKICYTELTEECLAEIQSSCTKEDETEMITENVESSPIPQQEHDCEYSDSYVMQGDCENLEESWVEDVACVKTIDDIAEHIEISGASSPIEDALTDNDESGVFSSSEHTDKVKYIYGDNMCNDDAHFVETLYNTPQMNVNKTLGQRETLVSGEYYDNYSLEKVLSESNDQVPSPYVPECIEPAYSPVNIDVKETVDNKENLDIESVLSVQSKEDSLNVQMGVDERNGDNKELELLFHDTQRDSCESNLDDVFSYKDNDNNDYTSSSSPEVSSTTSEERNSGILLKITNYKGSRISQINDCRDIKRPSCKFTEEKGYVPTHRPLLTKAAQKYIPPLKETMRDLKVKLSLPPHSLMKLKQLKKSKDEPKVNKRSTTTVPNISKKPKPKFEDVLKSIDEMQFKKHKEKNKKPKKSVPKVVIKKTENGSHYTSSSNKDEFNPDLTGRKWQPWVFIEKNHFIDKMAMKKKTKAIYSHRKRTYVLAEKFQKYKSVSSAKFVITPPISDHPSAGLKYTIRLKHSY